jgi:hypothetical protein
VSVRGRPHLLRYSAAVRPAPLRYEPGGLPPEHFDANRAYSRARALLTGVRPGHPPRNGSNNRISAHLGVACRSHLAPRITRGAAADELTGWPDVSLAVWMQTSGTALLAVERCSLVRVWMAAQDSHSAYGLLYLAAVRDDRHHRIRRVCQSLPRPGACCLASNDGCRWCATLAVVERCCPARIRPAVRCLILCQVAAQAWFATPACNSRGRQIRDSCDRRWSRHPNAYQKSLPASKRPRNARSQLH